MHIEGDWTRILEREVHKQPAAGHNGDRQRTYGQSGMSAANSPHEKCVFEKFMESVLLLIHSPHYEESYTCFEFKEIHEYFPCAVGLLLKGIVVVVGTKDSNGTYLSQQFLLLPRRNSP